MLIGMRRFLSAFVITIIAVFSLRATEVRCATYAVVYSFQGGYDGINPSYALLSVNGVLYGTTEYGGGGTCEDDNGYGCGTVFSLDPGTNSESVLYSFQNYGVDGSSPYAPLIRRHGALYGTTYWGPNEESGGTTFKINIATGSEKVLYSFGRIGSNGCFPTGALTTLQGALYGTTSGCGGLGGGTLFSFVPKTRHETLLYAFCSLPPSCNDGGEPNGNLVYDGESFYGTGIKGGGNNAGAIFKINPTTGKESVASISRAGFHFIMRFCALGVRFRFASACAARHLRSTGT